MRAGRPRKCARVALVHDPAGEKQERKWEAVRKIEAEKLRTTMGDLADEYFAAMILGRWKHPNIIRARIEHDIKLAIGRLPLDEVKPQHIDAMLKAIEYLFANKGYDSDAIMDWAEEHGMAAVIPPHKNRKVQRERDHHIYTPASCRKRLS
jgi:hypothetical protein